MSAAQQAERLEGYGFGAGRSIGLVLLLAALAGVVWVWFGMVKLDRWPIRWLEVDGGFVIDAHFELSNLGFQDISGIDLTYTRDEGEELSLDDTFVVANGDVLTDLDVGALVAAHRRFGAQATLHLIGVDDPSAFGVVDLADDGAVDLAAAKKIWFSQPVLLRRHIQHSEIIEHGGEGSRSGSGLQFVQRQCLLVQALGFLPAARLLIQVCQVVQERNRAQ